MIERFERNRPRLRAVAYRMLGSAAEADDAVQETWLRLQRSGTGIENMDAWLTTVVGRVCLDMLRSRNARREDALGAEPTGGHGTADPEEESLLADSVGVALLVVLETLTPAERLAFVLHDLFAVPFDEIAPIVGRTPEAARQLASRARRRVRHADVGRPADRRLVDAFLAASRAGDFTALLSLLDPDVRLRADRVAAGLGGGPEQLRGSTVVAQFFAGRAQSAVPALIDGGPGLWIAPVRMAVLLTVADGRIAAFDAVADPDRLRDLEIVPLGGKVGP